MSTDGPTGPRPHDPASPGSPQDAVPSRAGSAPRPTWPEDDRHAGRVSPPVDGLWRPRDGSSPAEVVVENPSDGSRKSAMVALGITAAVVAVAGIAIAADDDEEPTHAAVCVDQDTGTRIDDSNCDDDHHHGGHAHVSWFFFAYGSYAPRVGGPVDLGRGSYTPPGNSSYVRGGVPRDGGVVSKSSVKGGSKTTVRGGFGSSGKGSGG